MFQGYWTHVDSFLENWNGKGRYFPLFVLNSCFWKKGKESILFMDATCVFWTAMKHPQFSNKTHPNLLYPAVQNRHPPWTIHLWKSAALQHYYVTCNAMKFTRMIHAALRYFPFLQSMLSLLITRPNLHDSRLRRAWLHSEFCSFSYSWQCQDEFRFLEIFLFFPSKKFHIYKPCFMHIALTPLLCWETH